MGLSMGQWSVAGTVPVFPVPPVAASVTFYQSGTVPVWLGMSTATSTTNGMSVSTTPVTFRLAPGSGGTQLYATSGASATTAAIFYMIATDG
jgi:hypothetical protein